MGQLEWPEAMEVQVKSEIATVRAVQGALQVHQAADGQVELVEPAVRRERTPVSQGVTALEGPWEAAAEAGVTLVPEAVTDRLESLDQTVQMELAEAAGLLFQVFGKVRPAVRALLAPQEMAVG